MTDWITHSGGPCPVDGDTVVEVRFGIDGDEVDEGQAGCWMWEHIPATTSLDCHITAYRIVETPDED